MGRRFNRGRNDSGSLLAATFVVALGAGSIVFVVIALAPRESLLMISGIVAGMLLVMGSIAMLRFGAKPRMGLGFWNVRFRSHRTDGSSDDYTPRIRKNSPKHSGTNKPITANEARELRLNSASTWVPADSQRK